MKSALTAIGAVSLAFVVLAHSAPLAGYEENDLGYAEQTAMDGSQSHETCQKKTGGGKSNVMVRSQTHSCHT